MHMTSHSGAGWEGIKFIQITEAAANIKRQWGGLFQTTQKRDRMFKIVRLSVKYLEPPSFSLCCSFAVFLALLLCYSLFCLFLCLSFSFCLCSSFSLSLSVYRFQSVYLVLPVCTCVCLYACVWVMSSFIIDVCDSRNTRPRISYGVSSW